MERQNIRKLMRSRRNELSENEQLEAAKKIKVNIFQHLKNADIRRLGIYLSNDSEIDTSLIIEELWHHNIAVYLPILHPFCSGYLLFQRYEKNSPMTINRYGILEPKLNCSQVCPVEDLDVLCTPLVAFDLQGNRLGMGGGFYDRTLAKYYREKRSKPEIIGLAHNCQQVDLLPIESWDVPLKTIVTPKKCYLW
ncbi:5-formyltetrahydrofolate cyclo-ligase [Pseudoalteromonas piratica]|uniref:5-formyltetrahydrofolate cyclo-ligase n=2 Tax=Pseudoalteromonas piratica TaxID=1348114 RepID=A0A0A7EHQ1_9GAMM|nr:5-formyltetrahydrofolate cyclo-ligase [Pseudoalteromonas piratica]AIY66200.1 5-formyltetrahydrofolate cyclo-ligase [Pseudoalteromonas piratica]